MIPPKIRRRFPKVMEEALKDYLIDGLTLPDDYTINVAEDRINIFFDRATVFALYPEPDGDGILYVEMGLAATSGNGSTFVPLMKRTFQLADPNVLDRVSKAIQELCRGEGFFQLDDGSMATI